MEKCIGRRLRLEDVPDIILGPDDTSRRQRIEVSVENQMLAFGKPTETILGQKEEAKGKRWTGKFNVV